MFNRLQMQKSLNHFMHPEHPLKLFKGKKKPWKSRRCVICGLAPSEYLEKHKSAKQESGCPIYGCWECLFMIHSDCAKLPQELSHPFHPQHSLSLSKIDFQEELSHQFYPQHSLSPSEIVVNTLSQAEHPHSLSKIEFQKKQRFVCHACGISAHYPGFTLYVYRCDECNFNLDSRCIELQPLNDDRLKHQEISHQHPVFVCNQPTDFESHCSFCRSSFTKTDLIYVCVACKHLLHESCVFPQQIMHPFHLEHPLLLVPPPVPGETIYRSCSACSQECTSFFTCSQCKFSLDLSCISLKPTSLIKSSEDDQELQNQPHTHPHPLIQCDPIKDKRTCSGCESLIKDSVYVCLECGILLDKSCTQLLPRITSPFHPIHPLTLDNPIISDCRLCNQYSYLLKYVCRECNFIIDTRCAASVKPYEILNSRIHSHPLAFLIKKPEYSWHNKCDTCGERCEKFFLCCAACCYFIHLECCPSLPRVIKHDSHCDPLIFTDSQIKDASDEDSDEEFYCHACEDLRDLDDPTYYCKECHFVAHLQCVFPAILHGLEGEPTASSTSLRPLSLFQLPVTHLNAPDSLILPNFPIMQ